MKWISRRDASHRVQTPSRLSELSNSMLRVVHWELSCRVSTLAAMGSRNFQGAHRTTDFAPFFR